MAAAFSGTDEGRDNGVNFCFIPDGQISISSPPRMRTSAASRFCLRSRMPTTGLVDAICTDSFPMPTLGCVDGKNHTKHSSIIVFRWSVDMAALNFVNNHSTNFLTEQRTSHESAESSKLKCMLTNSYNDGWAMRE